MKFGEQLPAQVTPEWRKQYLDYNALKALLYQGTEGKTPDDAEVSRLIAKTDEAFFALVEEELVKVNLFFSQKLAEAQGKLYELSHDLELWKQASARETRRTEGFRSPLRLLGGGGGGATGGKTAHQLRLAFSEFYLGLVLLQNYQQLNATGFRKILKKRDKLAGNSKGLEWRQARVEKSGFCLTREIETLISRTENVVINELEGGDRSGGMKRLRVPPLSEAQSAWTTYRLGLYCGAFAVLVGVVLLKTQWAAVGAEGQPKWLGIRLFRGFLMLFLDFLLVGLNMYGWQSVGVNHVLIFELNPRHHLTYQALMEQGALLLLVWAAAVLGFLFAPELHCSALLFPLLLAAFVLLWTLNPLKHPHFTQRSSRYWFVHRLFNCFTAPWHVVTFPDFWLADQMNSFVTAFLDFQYFLCFYATEVSYDLTNWSIVAIPRDTASNSTLGINFETGEDVCSTNVLGIRPLVSLIPALIRFLQCLRRYRDTRKKHPHLTNAGKYSTSFFVVAIGALNTYWYHSYETWQSPLFYPWLGAYVVSFLYTLSWDIRMDWGLLETKGPHPILREELVYDRPVYYYGAMLTDAVLRLGWVLNLSLGDAWTMEAETLLCITAPLESIRRFVWNYFRLENEHLNNCGQFRAVRDISVKPIRSGDVDQLIQVMDSVEGVTHRGHPQCANEIRRRKKKGRGGQWRAGDPNHQVLSLARLCGGLEGAGVELNPWLVLYSKLRARREGLSSSCSFRRRDLFKTELSSTPLVVMFGTEEGELMTAVWQKPGTSTFPDRALNSASMVCVANLCNSNQEENAAVEGVTRVEATHTEDVKSECPAGRSHLLACRFPVPDFEEDSEKPWRLAGTFGGGTDAVYHYTDRAE